MFALCVRGVHRRRPRQERGEQGAWRRRDTMGQRSTGCREMLVLSLCCWRGEGGGEVYWMRLQQMDGVKVSLDGR